LDLEVFKSEWEDWRTNKVTKAFLKTLFDKREYLKEMMAENTYGSEAERLIDIGQCIAIKDNMDYAIYQFNYVERGQEENDTKSSGI
jgi:hypothetical protein